MANGSPWVFHPMEAMASLKASSTACQSPAKMANTPRIEGLPVDAFSRERMDFTLNELLEERDGVKDLLG
jgi:hypothetical protein